MRNVSDGSCRENQNTFYVLSILSPPPKSCRLWDNVEKYGGSREAAYNMAHALCKLDKWGYARESTRPCTHTYTRTHAHVRALTEMCDTYCFSTVTMVSWTRLNVTLYAFVFVARGWDKREQPKTLLSLVQNLATLRGSCDLCCSVQVLRFGISIRFQASFAILS